MLSIGKKTKRRRPRLVLLWVAATLTIGGVCVGLPYARWVLGEHRFAVVAEGEVYQSAQMPPGDLLRVVEQHGIRTVIDLRRDGEGVELERDALKRAGIRFLHLPTPQVPTQATVDRFLSIMDRPDRRPVLIHCKDGEGRSVLFSAIYRIEYEGWSNGRARRATRALSWRGSFAPRRRKGVFLLSYVPRRSGAGVAAAGEGARTAAGPRVDS